MAACTLDRSVEAVDGSTVDQYAAGACAAALALERSARNRPRAIGLATVAGECNGEYPGGGNGESGLLAAYLPLRNLA